MTRNHAEQRGAVLLLMLLLLVVAGSSLALSAFNSNPSLYRRSTDPQQLQRAKDALLAYAAHSATLHGDMRGPGFFPCPDTSTSDPDNDGIVSDDSYTACAGYDSVTRPLLGRLPEAVDATNGRYDLNSYNAGIDQQFWYALGNRYVAIPPAAAATSELRNSLRRTSSTFVEASAYQLVLDGASAYVALIIAPGEALADQQRPADPQNHSNYLELANGDSFSFRSGSSGNPAANDQIIGITLDEYNKAIGMPVVMAMKKQLDAWYESHGNEYPASPGYTEFPLASSSPGTQDEFQSVFYDTPSTAPLWLRSDAKAPPDQGNGENWPSFTHYLQLSNSRAQLAFADCAGIIYTIDFTGGIARSGDSC